MFQTARGVARLAGCLVAGLSVVAVGASSSAQGPGGPDGAKDPATRKIRVKVNIQAEIEIEIDTGKGQPVAKAIPSRVERSRALRLGIAHPDMEGQLAAREVFYEDHNGLAVMQGDIVVGKSAEMNGRLIGEMSKLARRAESRRSVNLSDEHKRALGRIQQIGGAPRAIINRSVDSPEVQELARAVALLPVDVLDALGLEPGLRRALDTLRDTPAGTDVLKQVDRDHALPERVKERLHDAAYREQIKAGLVELAARAGIGVRDLPADPVSRAVEEVQKIGPAQVPGVDYKRLAALARLASLDTLPLSPEQKSSLMLVADSMPDSVNQVEPGSPYLVPNSPDDTIRSIFRPFLRYRWPRQGGKVVVPYDFDPSVTAAEQEKIEKVAMKNYTDTTVITFKKRQDERDHIRFTITGKNLSAVGRQGEQQLVQLQSNAPAGTIIHEIGHALGLWHEMSRPDRDSTIEILYQNVQQGYAPQFDKILADGNSPGKYDLSSVMHYRADAFAVPGTVTIQLKGGRPLGADVGNLDDNKRLSDVDIENGIAQMYGSKVD